MKVLVTGGAGFIGNALAVRLLADGHAVVIVDVVNEYYDPALKEARLARLPKGVPVERIDIADAAALDGVFTTHGPFDAVAHLAAQAGVRYSIENPFAYAHSNYVGTQNIFELAKRHEVMHVVFASSSSVYGRNTKVPFTEEDRVDQPVSIYAATKRATELLAYAYVDLFHMDITALRFFTVYGPWSRPDMAPLKFTHAIMKGDPIDLYNKGDMRRDFTYIDDIVEGFVCALTKRQTGFEIFNIGNGSPVHLLDFVRILEEALGKKAITRELPMQAGDVPVTYADITKARTMLGFTPQTSVRDGVAQFAGWYREFYKAP
jgi:UDP-glucuronate 4-epimerase